MIKIRYTERIYEWTSEIVPILELTYFKLEKLSNITKIINNDIRCLDDDYVESINISKEASHINDNLGKNFCDIFGYEYSNRYIINFNNGLFDILEDSVLKFLDDILDELNVDYLNQNLWKEYLFKKHGSDFTIIHNEIDQPKFFYCYRLDGSIFLRFRERNKMYDFIPPIDDRRLREIREHFYFDNDDNIKNFSIETCVENEFELLFEFLRIIFTSDFNLKVVKCKNCGKYFITTDEKQKYCYRPFKDKIFCSSFLEKINYIKTHSGSPKIDKLRLKIYEKEKNRGTNKIFLKNELEMLKKYYDNDNEKVKFYLSYYIKKADRERNIKDLELEEYLNNE